MNWLRRMLDFDHATRPAVTRARATQERVIAKAESAIDRANREADRIRADLASYVRLPK